MATITTTKHIGGVFGRWTIGNLTGGREKEKLLFYCFCSCGNTKIMPIQDIIKGKSKSCGCLKKELFSKRLTKYKKGTIYSREYRIWSGMINRCTNENNSAADRYMKRGIMVCERWLLSFKCFLSDMGECPFNHSIDRIDNNGNYTPENCRWATTKIQARNTSTNVFITYNNETKTISEWSELTGISATKISYRHSRGFTADKIFFNGDLKNQGDKANKIEILKNNRRKGMY